MYDKKNNRPMLSERKKVENITHTGRSQNKRWYSIENFFCQEKKEKINEEQEKLMVQPNRNS